MGQDRIYSSRREMIVDFRFDEAVAAVFPDMIRRSVPGYDSLVPLLGLFASQHAQAGTRIYDLGCSLGAATLALRHYIKATNCEIVAVDNAEAMIAQCRVHLGHDNNPMPVSLVCADIRDIEITNASLVVINFTLQFIEPLERQKLIDKIYHGMVDGGALVIADKIVFEDTAQQKYEEGMHLAFKRANGYSELEISQKRTALEKVLIPDTMETHLDRVNKAGFSQTYPWFQCFNFAALCAIK